LLVLELSSLRREIMMRKSIALSLLAGLTFSAAQAAEAPACKKVRIADLGWTDIMLTNNTAEFILDALGYDATQTLLGMDVTYMSLKNNDMDVFQGNWRPFQDAQYKSYFDEGSVEVLGTNLKGAKFTLAVPKYASDAGIKDFNDLVAHADQFEKKIYALEPGSNQVLLDMIAANRHGLGQWELVESSEAGMLTQVKKAISEKQWIVFLGWEPHPMNLDYDMSYLTGGDAEFGPNFGGATVRTIARKGYANACPNVAKLFANLVYNLEYENHGMQLIIDEGKDAATAAREMMRRNPQMLDQWLEGVTTFDGKPALPAIKEALGS
jgi:glycine betaine/proline transport system substrate-binding protein